MHDLIPSHVCPIAQPRPTLCIVHCALYVKEDALSMRFSLKRVAAASVASHVLVARRPSAIV